VQERSSRIARLLLSRVTPILIAQAVYMENERICTKSICRRSTKKIFSCESKHFKCSELHLPWKGKISVEPVWGKSQVVGRKYGMRFEPINYEIEIR
jgi:hypothetical protein